MVLIGIKLYPLCTVPDRIRFNGAVPPDRRAEIAALLVPFADDGLTVTVIVPEDGTRDVGWRVLLNSPGRRTSFRVPTSATPSEWRAVVTAVLRPSD